MTKEIRSEYVESAWTRYKAQSTFFRDVVAHMSNIDSLTTYALAIKADDGRDNMPSVLRIVCSGDSAPCDILISTNYHNTNQYQISAAYPRGPLREDCRPYVRNEKTGISDHRSAPSINISIRKTVVQIASDILRRFMGEHRTISQHVIEQVAIYTKSHDAHTEMTQRVAALIEYHLGIDPMTMMRQSMSVDLSDADKHIMEPSQYGNDVSVEYGKINVKLNGLTLDGLTALLTLLRKGESNDKARE